MKRLGFALLLVCLASVLAFAQESATPVAAPVQAPAANATITLKGTLIDDTCAGANSANLADFIKTHTKQCALMSGCINSTYSLYANGKLYKFDQLSSDKVTEFLRKEENRLDVVVTARDKNGELSLISIANQE
jgi:hypothetical protein